MATTVKQWPDGGSLTIQYDGQGDGEIIVTSDPNTVYEARSMEFTVKTADGSVSITRTIQQAARQHIDISAAVVTASNQTYSGVAKTPTPTVTLDGTTIPSSGYDVAYSNNTNAGTATITVTGKGEYAGTATGTFTINKATPSYTAPSLRTGLTYSGSSQYLTTTGSTSHGTIYYSTNNSNWYTSRRTGTNAGTYYCYWKLVGDSNHLDVDSTYLGSTTIAKASRTLSFADSYMVLNTSSTGTKTATPSAGSGDGAITYSISSTTYATINSSTGAVTSKTSDGNATVTASIAEGTNYLSASASYTLYVFATTHNYSYNGSYRSVTLPPGTYQFQCWGAQGASCSDGYSGGKGGYSVGQLSISQATGIRVYVGGQGGYNGGGSSTGSSSYSSGDTYGRSSMGNGGGASDIRLSDGALLSRMIVAGGGSGGAYCYKEVTTTTTTEEQVASFVKSDFVDGCPYSMEGSGTDNDHWSYTTTSWRSAYIDISSYRGDKIKCTYQGTVFITDHIPSDGEIIGDSYLYRTPVGQATNFTTTVPSGAVYLIAAHMYNEQYSVKDPKVYIYENVTSTTTSTSSDYQYGYAGGGTNGVGYSSSYYGKQNAAGSGGSFGQGANQTITNYRFCSGAGGGGWYGGGGGRYSDSSMSYIYYSGGGSGFVNTAASAGNRPSGYTGLELDNGTTYAGNTSFPSTSGGTETGHNGNGYVRITRL